MIIQEIIAKRCEELDKIENEIERCERVSRRYIDMGRQLGKTTLMMKNLKEGDTVLCWRASDMVEKIKERRPDLDTSKITCYSVRFLEDLQQFSGMKPCLVDNALWDAILLELMKDFHSGKMQQDER